MLLRATWALIEAKAERPLITPVDVEGQGMILVLPVCLKLIQVSIFDVPCWDSTGNIGGQIFLSSRNRASSSVGCCTSPVSVLPPTFAALVALPQGRRFAFFCHWYRSWSRTSAERALYHR